MQPERRCTYCNTPMRRTAVRRAPRSGKVVLQVFSCGCKKRGVSLEIDGNGQKTWLDRNGKPLHSSHDR